MNRHPFSVVLLLATLQAGCVVDVPGYCDSKRPCSRADQICLLAEHACADVIAWGEFSGVQMVPPLPSKVGGSFKLAYTDDKTKVAYEIRHDAPKAEVREIVLRKGRFGTPALPAFGRQLAKDSGGTGTLALSPDEIAGIVAGEYFVEIQTEQMEGKGESRAQIYAYPPTGSVRLFANLSPLQHVTPIQSTGRGRAVVNATDKGIGYQLTLEDLRGTVLKTHIHYGAYTLTGGHLLDLPNGAPPMMGSLPEEQVLDPYKDLYPIVFRAGLAYFNVHTTVAEADGELRGQLLPSAGGMRTALPFTVLLRPTNQSALTGVAFFLLSEDQGSLTYRFDLGSAIPTAIRIFNGTTPVRDLPAGKALGTIDLGGAITPGDLMLSKYSLHVATAEYPMGGMVGRLSVPQ